MPPSLPAPRTASFLSDSLRDMVRLLFPTLAAPSIRGTRIAKTPGRGGLGPSNGFARLQLRCIPVRSRVGCTDAPQLISQDASTPLRGPFRDGVSGAALGAASIHSGRDRDVLGA